MQTYDRPSRFTKCPSLQLRETAQSYLGRLTSYFGSRTPREFCADFGLDLRGIMHGDEAALRQLADITSAKAEDLIRWSPQRIDEKYMSLNGQLLHTRDNPRRDIRLCPLCAKEDIADNPEQPWDQAVYGRAEWMLGVVDCCAVHHVKLISHRGPKLDAVRIDAGYEATILLEELHGLSVEAAMPDEFQIYVLARLGIMPECPSPLLDGLPLLVVCQICFAAGRDMLSNRDSGVKLTDVERRAAGFDLLGHGREALKQHLLNLRQGCKLAVGATSLLPNLMRFFYDGRYDDRQFAELVDALIDAIFRHLPYAEGQWMFGRQCSKRCLHDFNTAQAAYGIGRHHLRAFLAGTPELAVQPAQRPQDALIDVSVADGLFLGRTPFLNISAIAKKLGRSATLARLDLAALKHAGLIEEAKGASTGPNSKFYSGPELDAMMQRVLDLCDEVDAKDPAMVSLHYLGFKLGLSQQTFWSLFAAGRITRIGMVRGTGFIDGLRVDLQEVLHVVSGVEDAMILPEVADVLDVDDNIVRILEVHGILKPTPVNRQLTRKISRVFDRTEVHAFKKEFTPLNHVRKNVSHRSALKRLQARGFEPAIHLKPLTKAPGSAIFYRKSDLPQIE